jgi:hypothetical protein
MATNSPGITSKLTWALSDAVAERQLSDLDCAPHVKMLRRCGFGFRNCSDDVGKAVEMQSQQAELHQLIDETDGALVERLAKREECEQHADRETLPGQNQAGTEIDNDHVDQAGQQRLDEAKPDLILADRDPGIGDFCIEITPGALAFGFAAHQLDYGRRPHRFHEM